MTETRVVYPSSPLRVLSCELRFNYQPAYNSREIRDEFAENLRDQFPVRAEEKAPNGGDSTDALSQIRVSREDAEVSVSLNARSLAILVSGAAYEGLSDFVPKFRAVFDAASSLAPDTRVERIGLRYLNEVRLPVRDVTTGAWSPWISDALMAPARILNDSDALGMNNHVFFDAPDGVRVILHYADVRGASVIAPEIPVQLSPTGTDDDFFILDIDSSWNPDGPTRMGVDQVVDTLWKLHLPSKNIFESSITDVARAEFLKGGR